MRQFDSILFDLDGTLIDSVDLIVDSYQHTFTTHALPAHSREEILAGMGTPLKIVFGKLTADAAQIDAWIATYRAYNLAHHDARIQAYPDTVDMIRTIREAGFAMALVTSKNRAGAVRGINLIGLGDAFDAVVGADDVQRPKPDAEPATRALELLQKQAATALFVGDSHHDVHCGRAAGTWTAGVTWGPFDRAHLEQVTPDYYCDTPGELLQLLGITPG